MSIFDGFVDEIQKLAAFKIKKMDDSSAASLNKKKTFVPGMTQAQIRRSNAPKPKVQRFTYSAPKKVKVPSAGSLKGKQALGPKKPVKPKFDALDNLLKGIK